MFYARINKIKVFDNREGFLGLFNSAKMRIVGADLRVCLLSLQLRVIESDEDVRNFALNADKDDLVGYWQASLNRAEHYPHGARDKQDVYDTTLRGGYESVKARRGTIPFFHCLREYGFDDGVDVFASGEVNPVGTGAHGKLNHRILEVGVADGFGYFVFAQFPFFFLCGYLGCFPLGEASVGGSSDGFKFAYSA
jgi:hypothetical protein